MGKLFGRDYKTIRKHINNALNEELDNSIVAKFAIVQKEGNRNIIREIEHYNLDVIISVGYRIKSQNEELEGTSVCSFFEHTTNDSKKCNVQKMHFANSVKPVNIYNLDVIIRVGIVFRK